MKRRVRLVPRESIDPVLSSSAASLLPYVTAVSCCLASFGLMSRLKRSPNRVKLYSESVAESPEEFVDVAEQMLLITSTNN